MKTGDGRTESVGALPTTSVVICCYNDARFDTVVAAVMSVEVQVPTAPELVVVVDHNPGLLTRLALALPGRHLMENDGPIGLSGARNAGIVATRGALVVFLDDDASAAPDMVHHMAVAARDPAVLGIAGRIVPDWVSGAPRWFPDEFLWVVGCTYAGLAAGPVRNPIGAAMAVRRSVFAGVGGFTTGLGRTQAGLPLGCEETELAIRATTHFPNGHFVHVPEAVCRHRVPADRGSWSYLVTRSWAEGLSKAALSRLTGARDALSTERAYVRRVLPRGVLRGLGDALKGDLSGCGRAAAIAAGFMCTAVGYLAGSSRRVRTSILSSPTLSNPASSERAA